MATENTQVACEQIVRNRVVSATGQIPVALLMTVSLALGAAQVRQNPTVGTREEVHILRDTASPASRTWREMPRSCAYFSRPGTCIESFLNHLRELLKICYNLEYRERH